MKMKKIQFKDLSNWVKFGVSMGIAYGFVLAIAFLYGFFSAY